MLNAEKRMISYVTRIFGINELAYVEVYLVYDEIDS